VMKCLAKMPEQRPQTAQDLVVELDAMAIGSGDFAPAAMPARRWGAALAALALVAVVAGIVRAGRSGPAASAAKPDSAGAPAASKPAPAAGAPALTRADS